MKTAEEVAEMVVTEFLGQALSSNQDVDDWLQARIVQALIEFASQSDKEFRENYPKNLRFAHNQGLEEAARIADSQEKIHHTYSDSYEEGLRDMADLLGQAIRALKTKP